ncbi:nitric oxide-associated protein 1-like [Saccoglossus kowalevskii]|uniref:Nitric oxide-associated protein 1-like n=1 Tax=Saccoglossus kowalevskii TaxID=10224 RepID=A0ABM0GKH7_SACKO|nr:PREDICTED: nitric oxide-associated protein 1-like [Saccoglossus kowalevskii]
MSSTRATGTRFIARTIHSSTVWNCSRKERSETIVDRGRYEKFDNSSAESNDLNIIDQQYFSRMYDGNSVKGTSSHIHTNNDISKELNDFGEIDRQYFSSTADKKHNFIEHKSITGKQDDQSDNEVTKYINRTPVSHSVSFQDDDFDNEIDQQYFGSGNKFEENADILQSDLSRSTTKKVKRSIFIDTLVKEEDFFQEKLEDDLDKLKKELIKKVTKLLSKKDDLPFQKTTEFKEQPVAEEDQHGNFDYLSKESHLDIDLDQMPPKISDLLSKKTHGTFEDHSFHAGTVASGSLENEVMEVLKSLKRKRQPIRKARLPATQKIYGTPDPSIASSMMPCAGCGATLHCHDIAKPGYLPSEKFTSLNHLELERTICQRCWLLTRYQLALDVKVTPTDFVKLISQIKRRRAMVICMVDLMDFPCSIFPNLKEIIGNNKQTIIVGNKLDILPKDSPKYLEHIKTKIIQECVEAGIALLQNIRHVALISAKSGFGVEDLITQMQQIWRYKGDVYLVGCTNVGKSTLFNRLLESDYCKTKVSNILHKATISLWPGTTLNLLKFPILSPTLFRMTKRRERLKAEVLETNRKLLDMRFTHKIDRAFDHSAYVRGTVGQTFKTKDKGELNYSVNANPFLAHPGEQKQGKEKEWVSSEMPVLPHPNELRQAKWFYDTPGVINKNQILTKLTSDELKLVLPSRVLTPQTIRLKPSQSFLLAGLGRLDYLQGGDSILLTVFASHHLPVYVMETLDAEIKYKENNESFFKVPVCREDRPATFPPLIPKDITITGIGWKESTADVLFSSAGWAAVTIANDVRVKLKVYTPNGWGCILREPALLPFAVNMRGKKQRRTNISKMKHAFYTIDKKKLMKFF